MLLLKEDNQLNKINSYLLFLLVFSILFFPPVIQISRYTFGLEEALVGISAIFLLFGYRKVNFNNYAKLIIGFLGLIGLSLIIHAKSTNISDSLELYRVLKYLVVFLLASNTELENSKVAVFVKVSFCLLLIINLLHFYNAFSINQVFIILYDTDKRDTLFFGLDSLMRPGPKRIIGTLGNPNDNAIVLLFYFAYFLKEIVTNSILKSWKVLKTIDFFLLALTLTLIILTQSRTAFLVIGVFIVLIGIFIFIFNKGNKTGFFILLLSVILGIIFTYFIHFIDSFFGNSAIDLSYLKSGIEMHKNTSMAERIRIWKLFIGEFLQKPLLGWGSQKEYLYRKELHTDNEYVLNAWRYGVLGIALHLGLIFYYFKEAMKKFQIEILLTICTVVIVSITNAPLSHSKISLLYFIIIGSFAYQLKTRNKTEN